MNRLEEHHDLALQILVGRSLPRIPWTMEEDQALLSQERILWASLTDEERAQEQEALVTLWESRRAVRTVQVNPEWGEWTEGLTGVQIPNSAFGIPSNDLRPYDKGVPIDENPNAKWLFDHGFQVVDFTDGVYTMMVTNPRLIPEADRLLGLLARKYPGRIQPWGSYRGGIQIRGAYDPVAGLAVLELVGI